MKEVLSRWFEFAHRYRHINWAVVAVVAVLNAVYALQNEAVLNLVIAAISAVVLLFAAYVEIRFVRPEERRASDESVS